MMEVQETGIKDVRLGTALDAIKRRAPASEQNGAFIDTAMLTAEHAPLPHEAAHNPLEPAFGAVSFNSSLFSGRSELQKLLAVLGDPTKRIRHTAGVKSFLWGTFLAGMALTGLVFFGKAVGLLGWNIWSILS